MYTYNTLYTGYKLQQSNIISKKYIQKRLRTHIFIHDHFFIIYFEQESQKGKENPKGTRTFGPSIGGDVQEKKTIVQTNATRVESQTGRCRYQAWNS